MENKRNKKRKGFTLIELVVVIAILAVLAASAVAAYGNISEQAARSSRNANAQTLTRGLNTFNSLVGGDINGVLRIEDGDSRLNPTDLAGLKVDLGFLDAAGDPAPLDCGILMEQAILDLLFNAQTFDAKTVHYDDTLGMWIFAL